MEHKRRLARLAAAGPEKIAAAALSLFGLIAFAVTVIAIAESYSNLLAFALDHGLAGWRAAIAPAAVDSFIVMGELLLFANVLAAWDSALAYGVGIGMTLWGFGLSVAGNVWHAAAASPVDRAVAAIWPVTATAGLAGSLIILRHVMASRGTGKTAVPVPAAEKPSPVPASRRRDSPRPVPVRAARTPGPVAASDREAQVARELVTRGESLSIRKISAEYGLPIRAADRAQKLAAAQMNGAGHEHAGRS